MTVWHGGTVVFLHEFGGMAWWYGMTVWHGGTVVFLHEFGGMAWHGGMV